MHPRQDDLLAPQIGSHHRQIIELCQLNSVASGWRPTNIDDSSILLYFYVELGRPDIVRKKYRQNSFDDPSNTETTLSKAFIAEVIRNSTEITHTSARQAATDLMDAISVELKKEGKFSLPGFGTFTVRQTKARQGLNPRTGAPVTIQAGKTVRFKASKMLKEAV